MSCIRAKETSTFSFTTFSTFSFTTSSFTTSINDDAVRAKDRISTIYHPIHHCTTRSTFSFITSSFTTRTTDDAVRAKDRTLDKSPWQLDNWPLLAEISPRGEIPKSTSIKLTKP